MKLMESSGVRVKGQSAPTARDEIIPLACRSSSSKVAITGKPYLLASNEKQRQQAWRELTRESLDIVAVAKVRRCVNSGLVLGTETFRQQVHQLRI